MTIGVIPLAFISLFVGDLPVGRLSVDTMLGRQTFHVEIATSPLAQMRGLMHRDRLAEGDGMLFVYPDDRSVRFWMKNVSFPLDMLFIDRCGVVLSIHKNAAAFDETIIHPNHLVRMVLELRGGASKRAQIRKGLQFDLSALLKETPILQPAQSAADPLPCLN